MRLERCRRRGLSGRRVLESSIRRRSNSHRTAVVLACLVLWLVEAGTIQATNRPGSGHKASEQKKVIHVGYEASLFSAVDLKDAQIALELWMKQITDSRSVDYSVESSVCPDFASLAEDIWAKKLEIVNICALDYVLMPKDLPFEPFMLPCKGDSPLVRYKIMVHKASGISRLSQLDKGTLVIQSGGHARISGLWLQSLMHENNLGTAAEFFRSVQAADKPSQVVLPVFFKKADACLVSADTLEMMAELNPQVGNELVELAESPGFVNIVSCFHRDFDPELKKVVKDNVYLLHKNPGGKQILTLFRMDKAISFDRSYIRDLEALAREFDNIQGDNEKNIASNPGARRNKK